MPLIFTDAKGMRYRFEDPGHAELVMRLAGEISQQAARILELETEKDILEVKLRRAREEQKEVVNATVAYLDPDRWKSPPAPRQHEGRSP